MKNKKGFTLVEIIVCISLIVVIGVSTTFVVIKSNKNKEQKLLDKYASTFDNALEVYLSNHQEITDNLSNNAKAAAITLEVLKDDGLIDKVDGIDYKENYYLLSNAKLLDSDNTSNVECDNDVVGIEIFKKWDLSKVDDGSKVIYVCPKDSSSGSSNNSQTGIDELEKRISALEKASGNSKNVFFGDDVNNYVYFNVDDSSSMAYWPSTDKNLWRIYSYYGTDGSSSNIKLVYSQKVNIDENYKYVKKYELSSENTYKDKNGNKINFEKGYSTDCMYDGSTVYILDDKYYKYVIPTGYSNYMSEITIDVSDYLPDTAGFECTVNTAKYDREQFNALFTDSGYASDTVKGHLYEKIKYKDWIDTFPYYTKYDGLSTVDAKIDYSYVVYDKIGVINQDEFNSSILNSKTWLDYYTNNFVGELEYKLEPYMVRLSSSGTIRSLKVSNEPTAELVPVITLKTGVKIVADESCSDAGSKSCPYRLSFDGVMTDNS